MATFSERAVHSVGFVFSLYFFLLVTLDTVHCLLVTSKENASHFSFENMVTLTNDRVTNSHTRSKRITDKIVL